MTPKWVLRVQSCYWVPDLFCELAIPPRKLI